MELVRHIVDEAQRLVPQRITFRWQHACKARAAHNSFCKKSEVLGLGLRSEFRGRASARHDSAGM